MLCVTTKDNRPGSTMIRTYSELSQLETFEERFRYLALSGVVGEITFGHDRWMNQQFYSSYSWRQLRDEIIVRDNGCDLGIEDRPIRTRIYIHHMVPMRREDLVKGNPDILNPEYLISVTHQTHNAIHYSDERQLVPMWEERRANDTTPWRTRR